MLLPQLKVCRVGYVRVPNPTLPLPKVCVRIMHFTCVYARAPLLLPCSAESHTLVCSAVGAHMVTPLCCVGARLVTRRRKRGSCRRLGEQPPACAGRPWAVPSWAVHVPAATTQSLPPTWPAQRLS